MALTWECFSGILGVHDRQGTLTGLVYQGLKLAANHLLLGVSWQRHPGHIRGQSNERNPAIRDL